MQFNFAVILGLALAANLSTTVLGAPAPSRNRVPEGVPTGSGAGLGRNSDDRGTVVSASVSTDPKARNPKDQSTITVTKQVQYETPEALKDGQFFAEPPIAPAAEAQSHNTLGQRAKPKTSFRDLKKAAGNKIQSSRTAIMGKKEDLNANFEFLTGPLALPSASGNRLAQPNAVASGSHTQSPRGDNLAEQLPSPRPRTNLPSGQQNNPNRNRQVIGYDEALQQPDVTY